MFTPPPGTADMEHSMFVNLGSTKSMDSTLDVEIHHIIEKASIAFGRREERLWADKKEKKIVVYAAFV